jgi:Putative MetA-pathway of phenol degradation
MVINRRTVVRTMAKLPFANRSILVLAICFLCTVPVVAQDTPIGVPGTQLATEETPAAATNTDALRKAAQNPIASLISVPVQNNSNFGISPDGRIQDVLNIQPVIPARVSENWNLITRIITPIVYQPTVSQPINQGAYGFGDLNPSFFLSPAKPGKIIWGVGPAIVLPTATNPFLGQGKWSIGPSVVVLTQPGKWTLGALVNNVFSVAGQSRRPDVNQMLFQYFINYNLKKGYYITWQPTLTADWEAANGGRWVVPFGGGVGRIMKLGFQPVNLTAQFYVNAVHPAGASPWGMRLQIAFLFPKLSKEQQKMLLQQKLKQMDQEEPQK